MILQRILDVFKSGGKSKAPTFAPPDPANEFTHPENQSLFGRFKENSRVVIGGYEVRTHPDLISILYDLINDSEVRKGSAYGRPVMANRHGLVFAYAGGTHYIFLKLRDERHDAARQDGGRFDPTYGKDWIEFRLGGRTEDRSDWQEAMRRWSLISLRDSLSIETGAYS